MMRRIYLAGGMRSGWQDKVIAAAPEHDYIDPRSHGLSDPSAYTQWDLDAVRRCDLMLAYLERDNPVGFNLTLEIGFAHALGKPIYFVIHPNDPRRDRGVSMALVVCKVLDSLDEAIAILNQEIP